MGNMTAARQKNITATKPIHLAYREADLLKTEMTRRTRVVVTLIQPRKTQRRLTSQTPGREGEKQSRGLLCRVTQLWSNPSLVSPPTSDTIQSGMERLATANMSAARNKVPEMMVSLSITSDLDGGLACPQPLHTYCGQPGMYVCSKAGATVSFQCTNFTERRHYLNIFNKINYSK